MSYLMEQFEEFISEQDEMEAFEQFITRGEQ
jgi:hypothetical protein